MRMSRLFKLEASLAVLSGILFVITLVSKEWIEIIFRVDPDHGSGSLEWTIVAVLAVAAVTCTTLARIEWRRTQPAADSTSA